MQAKNYAAQAVRGLREWAGKAMIYRPDLTEDVQVALTMSSLIETAVHLSLPDGGLIFDDGLKGLRGQTLNLPFPTITVEYFVPPEDATVTDVGDTYVAKRLILAHEREENGQPVVSCLVVCEVDGRWIPMQGECSLFREGWDSYDEQGRLRMNGLVRPVLPGMFKQLVKQEGEDRAFRFIANDVEAECAALLELCEALTCSNVSAPVVQKADAAKNARRVKDGKLPIYETRMLMVDVGKESGERAALGSGQGDRNGPRQHLRRGHIRNLADGRRVWVSPCRVGSSERGIVHKTYGMMPPKTKIERTINRLGDTTH